MDMPHNFQQWNPAMRGVFKKGITAFQEGKPFSDCPYEDKRKDSGRLTWSRAFIACWCDGWRHAEADKAARDAVDEYYRDRNGSGQSPLNAHR